MRDSTTPQDDAAMSPASTGSVDEPVAWWFKCNEYESVTLLREHADAMAEPYGTTPIPLYRSQSLTDAERQALDRAIDALNGVEDMSAGTCSRDDAAADALRGLLERTK